MPLKNNIKTAGKLNFVETVRVESLNLCTKPTQVQISVELRRKYEKSRFSNFGSCVS